MRFVHDTHTIPRDPRSDGLQVLAAGQWRRATSSLQISFEEVLPSLKGRGPLCWRPACTGAYITPVGGPARALLRRLPRAGPRQAPGHAPGAYNASSGWPGMVFADDLMDMYPDVWGRAEPVQQPRGLGEERPLYPCASITSTTAYLLLTYWVLPPQSYWHHQAYAAYKDLARRRYGVHDVFTIETHEAHARWVHDEARARGKQVLEWAPKDGWKPLCAFLGRRRPPDVPFPASNERDTMKKLTRYLVLRGLLAWIGVAGVVAVTLSLPMKFFVRYCCSVAAGPERH